MPDLSPVSTAGASALSVAASVAATPVGRDSSRLRTVRAARLPDQRSDPPRRSTVYLDYLASTPCDPDAAALMRRLAVEEFANPSSSHAAGRRAARRVERAREQLAEAIDALPEEIVFTSGATESNNLAILGVAAAARQRDDPRRKLLTLRIEHPSVLEPMAELARQGWLVEFVPVRRDGRIALEALEEALDGALLLSVQAANNEIGTIQPLREVSRMAAERGVLVHSDAVQILGKAPLSVEDLHLDFASLSAHKCHGPKGVGALWVRGGPLRAPIRPLTFGGGQEMGLRPGTLNAPALAAFGLAVETAMARLDADAAHASALRDRLERELAERLGGRVRINGALGHRLPHATSLTFFDLDGRPLDADALVANLPEFDLSTASACHAGTPEPSHVLRAIGLSNEEAYGTLRVGFGRGSGDGDGRLPSGIVEAVRALRQRTRIETPGS